MNYFIRIVCTLLLVFAIISAKKTIKCTFNKKCRCYSKASAYPNVYQVDCSMKHLETVPVVPNTVKVLDLSHNWIPEVPSGHFYRNSKLHVLFLSYNSLKVLFAKSFEGLVNITKLTLNNNNISIIENDSFSQLYNLQILDLKNNRIHISASLLANLTLLKILRMDFVQNEKSTFPEGLTRLINLDISGLSGRCKIQRLEEDTFHNLQTLKKMDISACKINYVNKGTFKLMSNLSTLDVSYNPCLKFSGLQNITFNLPFTSIKILKANKIHNTFEMNTKLLKSHIGNINYTKLRELHLESNRIQLIESGALRLFPSTIRKLSLSDNEFMYGNYLWEVRVLPINFLNASFLFMSHPPNIEDEICIRLDSDKCDYMYNISDQIDSNVFSLHQPFLFPVPTLLKTLIYRQCQVRYEIPPMTLSENSIEHIDISQNMFFSWIGPLLILNNVTSLNLSYNICTNVSKVFFQSVPNLKYLYAQNNLLGFVLPYDLRGEILEHIPHVEEINLAENRIPTLPFLFFKSQTLLKSLILDGNMLDDIAFGISHMIKLHYLGLPNNRIAFLSQSALGQLDAVFDKHANLTIDLSGNPLKCTCDTLKFIEWMSSTKIILYNINSYNCELFDGNAEPLREPKRVYEILRKKCSSYTSLIIGISALVLLFLFILVWGLVYRYRWRLRYFYYMVRTKYQDKGKYSLSATQDEFEYDIFVSYEDKDICFVHNTLLNELETLGGLRLCLHKRDFLPGNYIATNITSAIHRSRKMLVIMSENYLNSYWCMFEYNMARLESIYSRNKENIMFLVFLEPISTEKLPLIVLELVQSQSYIEYPNDEYGNTIFWKTLQKALT